MNLNALTDEGIETILKAASQNQTLTYLSLQVCVYMHLFNLNNEIFIDYASHIICLIFYTIFKNICTHHAVLSKKPNTPFTIFLVIIKYTKHVYELSF